MKRLAVLLLLAGPALAGPTQAQCKQGCKAQIKPACEKACRTRPPKYVEPCIKELCELALKKCDELCDEKKK